MKETNVLKKIINMKDQMSKKQKIVCEFFLDNYQNIEIYSVEKMAHKAGVGTTTILRTISNLGYDSLNAFKKDIHKVRLESHAPTWWQFDDEDSEWGNARANDSQIRNVWNNINLLQEYSMGKQLEDSINETISMFVNASRINIFGLRTSRAVALYLENSINQFYPKCNQLSYEPHFAFDRLYHMDEAEVLVIIALSQYTTLTYEVAKFAVEKNIPIILITDNQFNSLIPMATITMKLAYDDRHFSIVPAISLVETLAVSLGSHLGESSRQTLDEVGQLIAKKNITKL